MIKLDIVSENTEQGLKPCPFCGGEAQFDVSSNGSDGRCVYFVFNIKCGKCALVSPKRYSVEFCLKETGAIVATKDGRNQAIEDWNRRNDNGKKT